MTENMTGTEQKREAAIQYLRSRGIHRAEPQCTHRYERCDRTPPPPRIDVSPSGNPVFKEQ